MSQNNTTVTYGGPGFLGFLTLLFIGLKLANIITWSWLWVFAPIWIPIALALVIFVVAGTIWLISQK